jgi:signal transduction histidine kinase
MIAKETSASPNPTTKASRLRMRHRSWWVFPQPFDLVSLMLYLSVLVPYIYGFSKQIDYTPPILWWQAILMCLTIMALIAVDRVEYWLYGSETPRIVAIALISTRIVLIEIVSWLDQVRYSPFLYFIVLFLACLYFGELVGYGLAVLVWIAYFVKHMYYSPGWLSNGTELHYLVLFTVGCIFAITIGRVVIRERASRTQSQELLLVLEQSHRQLQNYAEQVEELAATRERNRLARDIHDSLGHYLTVIIVQLEKALVFRDKKPEEADKAVSDAKHLASEALQDVRHSVSTLRSTHELLACSLSITRLVENIRSEHCLIDLHLTGNESGFSQQSLQTLYRVVQEGLTNIQKHAQADHIEIELQFEEQMARLTIHDNGQGFDTGSASQKSVEYGGYGLQGLYERMELVSGHLELISTQGKGTTLHAMVPRYSYMQLASPAVEMKP